MADGIVVIGARVSRGELIDVGRAWIIENARGVTIFHDDEEDMTG